MLQSSGAISSLNIRTEASTSGTLSLDSANIRAIAGVPSGTINFSDFYGKYRDLIFTVISTLGTSYTSGGGEIYGIAYNNTRYVAVGTRGAGVNSTDSVSWSNNSNFTSVWGSSNHAYAVVWIGTKFVVSGNNGNCATSTDGLTWTSQNGLSAVLGTTNDVRILVWTGSLLLAFTRVGTCATSTDGITWTLRISFNTAWGATPVESATFGNNKIVAVGYTGGRLGAVSSDGITWSPIYVYPTYNHGSVIYANSKFVSVSQGDCYTSTDGSTWNKSSSYTTAINYSAGVSGGYPQIPIKLGFKGTTFIARGRGGICVTSLDAVTWKRQSGYTTSVVSSNNLDPYIYSAGTNMISYIDDIAATIT